MGRATTRIVVGVVAVGVAGGGLSLLASSPDVPAAASDPVAAAPAVVTAPVVVVPTTPQPTRPPTTAPPTTVPPTTVPPTTVPPTTAPPTTVPPTTVPPTTVPPTTVPPTTVPPTTAPPTTVPPPTTAPPDLAAPAAPALYVGRLGRLGLDEEVVVPVAGPPPILPADRWPLTGMPRDPATVPRPAVVVKIDNAPAAAPQQGLVVADLVYEEIVEGGATRFAAVLHSGGDVVGPVRSFRSTDIAVLVPLGRPLLAYSGANAVFLELLAERPVEDRGHGTGGYWRQRGRRAPHNLFTRLDSLRRDADPPVDPVPPLVFDTGQGTTPAAPVDAYEVTVGRNRVRWEWDTTAWRRHQGGRPHDGVEGPIRATTVVVQEVAYVPSGLVDSTRAPVPEADLVGQGRAVILTAGGRIDATWTRSTLRTPTTFTTATGEHVVVPPGPIWVELVERLP